MKQFIYKRPFLYAALFCVGCSLSIVYGNVYMIASLCAAVVFVLIFAVLYLKGTVDFLPAVLIVLCSVLVFLSSFFINSNYILKVSNLDGKTISERCVVTDIVSKNVLTVRCDSIEEDAKFSLIGNELSYGEGDILKVTGSFSSLSGDYKIHNFSNGIYGTIYSDDIVKIGGYKSAISEISDYISECISENVGSDSAAFVKALLIGNKNELTYYQSAEIRAVGVSHLVVVSGLHLGIICGGVYWVLRKIKTPTVYCCIISLLLVGLIVAICGFSMSVVRAALVYIIMLGARLLGRSPDPLNSLCAAVCLILICSPYAIGNVSFLLSVGATFGLIMLSPMIIGLFKTDKITLKLVRKLVDFIIANISVSISAVLATLPVTIYYFGCVSLIGIVSNLLLTFAVTAILYMTLAAIVLSSIPVICSFIFYLVEILCNYSLSVISVLGNGDKFCLNISNNLWFVALLIFIFVIILIEFVKDSYKLKKEAMSDENLRD